MREHRYTLDMPHSTARLWALFQDYDNWTQYAPMVEQVEVVHPGDQHGNGLLRRVIYQMPMGRKGAALELVTDVAKERGYTFTMLSHKPGNDQTGKVRLEPIGPNQTRFHFEERYHLTSAPWKWFEGRIYGFINKKNEETMRAASQWLTDHPEYRPDLVGVDALPESMPAAVYREKGVLEVVDVDTPTVGPHDVLLEVSHCGVCGSDLHMVLEGWGTPDAIEGHEYTGIVAAVGSDVTRWTVGQQVVAGPSRRCGECAPCLAGRPSLCLGRGDVGTGDYQGAFARYSLTHEDEVLALPDGLTMREAALAEPLAVALHGITQAQVQPDHRVIVFGAGPIGALTTAALVAKGVTDLTVVEPGETRQALARNLGATRVVAPDQLAEPGWHPGHLVDEPYDRAIECSGNRKAMEQALGQLGRMGRLVFVGAGIDGPRFDANRIMLNEIEITGAFVYDATGFEDALALLPQLPLEHLIEPVDVTLPGLFDAMERLAAGELAGKVMVTPGGN